MFGLQTLSLFVLSVLKNKNVFGEGSMLSGTGEEEVGQIVDGTGRIDHLAVKTEPDSVVAGPDVPQQM